MQLNKNRYTKQCVNKQLHNKNRSLFSRRELKWKLKRKKSLNCQAAKAGGGAVMNASSNQDIKKFEEENKRLKAELELMKKSS